MLPGKETGENSYAGSGTQTPNNLSRLSRAANNLKKLAANNFIKEQAALERQLPYAERLKKIVKSPHRTYDDAKFLYEDLQFTPFCSKFLNIDDYEENAIVEVFKNLKYEYYQKGSVIIREGDESNNKAYILMSGTVSIYRKKETFFAQQNKDLEIQEEAELNLLKLNKNISTNPLRLDPVDLNTSMNQRNKRAVPVLNDVNSHHGSRRNSIEENNVYSHSNFKKLHKDKQESEKIREILAGTLSHVGSRAGSHAGSHMGSHAGSNAGSKNTSRRGSNAENFYLPSNNEVLTLPGISSPALGRRSSIMGTIESLVNVISPQVGPGELVLPASPGEGSKEINKDSSPPKFALRRQRTNKSDKSPKMSPTIHIEKRVESAKLNPQIVNEAVLTLKKYSRFHGNNANIDVVNELKPKFDKSSNDSDEGKLNVPDEAMSNLLKLSKTDHSDDSSDEIISTENLGNHLKDIDERGEMFGEVALENDSKRTATIYAKEDIELLTITKVFYESIGKKHKQKLTELSNFIIKTVPGLEFVSEDSTREMMRFFKLTDYRRHHTPMLEGECDDDVLVVYDGEVKLMKTVNIEIDDNNFDGPSKVTKLFRKKRYDKEEITIAQHGRGSIFGEEVLLAKKNEKMPYLYTLKVETESAKIFRISKSALKMQFPIDTIRELRQIYLDKKDERDSEFCQELTKRSLEIVSEDLNSLPLVVKRLPLKVLQQKSTKINHTIGKVNSLAILASKSDERYLQKTVPNSQRSEDDGDHKTFESYRNFSRFKFLPQTFDQREAELELHPEHFSQREVLHHKKRHHYVSSHEAPKNIDEYLQNYEKKFKIAQKQQAEHKKINDIKRFKLNFASNEEVTLQEVIARQKRALEKKEYIISGAKNMAPISQRAPKFKKYFLPKLKGSPAKTELERSLAKSPYYEAEVLKLPDISTQQNDYLISPPAFNTEPGADLSMLRKLMNENSSSLHIPLNSTTEEREKEKEKRKEFPKIEPRGNKYTDKNNLKKLVAKAKGRYEGDQTKIRVSDTWDFSNVFNNSNLQKSSTLVQGELFYLLGQPHTTRERDYGERYTDKHGFKHVRVKASK